MKGKAVIVSAPSGAGKTTLVRHLLKEISVLAFSVSACSRPQRAGERNGYDYCFISAAEFRERIARNEFVEWQEVYPGSYYGTLKTELERIWSEGKIPIFDVDVVGGLNLKDYFGESAFAVFISPPSIGELEKRLRNRGTESEETIGKRVGKAAHEMTFAGRFDRILINDNLEEKCNEITAIVQEFLGIPATNP